MGEKKSFLLEGQDVQQDTALTNDLFLALIAPESVPLKTSLRLHLPFEWLGVACFVLCLWVALFKIAFWHISPVHFSGAKEQPGISPPALALLNSSVL